MRGDYECLGDRLDKEEQTNAHTLWHDCEKHGHNPVRTRRRLWRKMFRKVVLQVCTYCEKVLPSPPKESSSNKG